MRAVRLHDALDLRTEDTAVPSAPPPGYVNLKVRAAGICGSDLHNFRTGQWISRRPSTVGHEFCGEVIAVGDGVADLQIGDLVSADSRFWCGECPACVSGQSNICEKLGFVGEVCDGGFAEQAQLPAKLLFKHDPDLKPRVAAMAEPLAVALHAVRRLSPREGEPVLVIGCGTIGGLSALLLSRMHKGPLLLADLNADRLDLVQSVTAGERVDLDGGDIERALGGQRLRYALDATGSVQAIKASLELLSGGGALALVGISHGRLDIDPNILVEKEIGLLGCHAFNGELTEVIRLLPELAPSLEQLCEVIPSLDDVPSTYDKLLIGASSKLKSVVEL